MSHAAALFWRGLVRGVRDRNGAELPVGNPPKPMRCRLQIHPHTDAGAGSTVKRGKEEEKEIQGSLVSTRRERASPRGSGLALEKETGP